MTTPKHPGRLDKLLQLIHWLLSQDPSTLLARMSRSIKALDRLLRRHFYYYSYEVLDRETTLELCDPTGGKAIARHRKSIRFLQNDITAVTDCLWGTGCFFKTYTCSPGVPVDFYEAGSRWKVLISLQETKSRGDTITLKTERTMLEAFVDDRCWWEEEIRQPTKRASVTIIFPKERHCQRATVTQRSRHHTSPLDRQCLRFLGDGRQALTWKTTFPQLHDLYRIRWSW